jgi:hypothetical protein
MSLLDMMDFSLFGFVTALKALAQEVGVAQRRDLTAALNELDLFRPPPPVSQYVRRINQHSGD